MFIDTHFLLNSSVLIIMFLRAMYSHEYEPLSELTFHEYSTIYANSPNRKGCNRDGSFLCEFGLLVYRDDEVPSSFASSTIQNLNMPNCVLLPLQMDRYQADVVAHRSV